MKYLNARSLVVLVLMALLIFVGCRDDDDEGNGVTGPGSGGDELEPNASFSSTEMVFDNSANIVWIESDLTIEGYQHRSRMTVGGYWYRRSNDGNYYYVTADCGTNVPSNRLGHQFSIQITGERTVVRNQQFAAMQNACFADQTGVYYGRIKLYDSRSIGIDPNTAAVAVSRWVSFRWTSAKSSGQDPAPVIRVLSVEESEELDEMITHQPLRVL